MKVGDLVTLSSAGKKIQSNYLWKTTTGYGLVTGITRQTDATARKLHYYYKVLLFDKKGVRWNTRYYLRYELKKFKKFE